MCNSDKYTRSLKIVESQTREIIAANKVGVVAGLAIVTCPCGWKRGLTLVYKCLYCKVYLCHLCAEEHFGKTVKEYRNEKA